MPRTRASRVPGLDSARLAFFEIIYTLTRKSYDDYGF
jgi:hypothetical protein